MKGTGGHVLYLDFDDTVHHENCLWHPRVGPYLSVPEGKGYVLFQHAELLEQLLLPYPDVQIVLSTAWVLRYGQSKTAKFLRPSLRARVIGATFHSQTNDHVFEAKSRGLQVLEDVLRRRPNAWLAIDDNDKDWPEEALGEFIKTHEHDGISESDVLDRLKQKLSQTFG